MQQRQKAWHDQHIQVQEFKKDDKVLVYDSRYHKILGKLQMQWLGPFKVLVVFENGSLLVEDIEDNLIKVTSERDQLKEDIQLLKDKLETAYTIVDEKEAIIVEAHQVK